MNATEELIGAARKAMIHAHAPYSRFAVGAAVRLTDGQIVTGCNFENASYGLSLCAETVALATVNAQGRFVDVEAIAVVGGAMGADGAVTGDAIVTPCGRCRQIMNEAEQMAGRALAIYCAAPEGHALVQHSVAELLPHAFGPRDLGILPGKS
ncbi:MULTISPECIES: cytidine deaminase [Sphingobium]|uniref:Cytidine deaminase n=1 Tax=Sphingobium chungbukense TaxID=56193 RepID=A0A0M3AIV7_9SPHN|nr:MULTISPECIES: cytidine deaminase [Sphingobium]KKW90022.1 cytidine deaminase [Sphingobium chungbukense]PJG49289.1 cytidine deaminase [Sphingobium sp. LB126]